MYYLTFKNKRYKISAFTFYSILSIVAIVVGIIGYSIYFAYGWVGIVLFLALAVSFNIDGKEHALIKSRLLQSMTITAIILSSIVIWFFTR